MMNVTKEQRDYARELVRELRLKLAQSDSNLRRAQGYIKSLEARIQRERVNQLTGFTRVNATEDTP